MKNNFTAVVWYSSKFNVIVLEWPNWTFEWEEYIGTSKVIALCHVNEAEGWVKLGEL